MLSEDLVDLATRYQVYLERYKAGALRDADVILADMQQRLRDALNEIEEDSLGELGPASAAALIELIRQILSDGYKSHLKVFSSDLRKLAEYAREYELDSLDHASEDEIEPDDGDAEETLWPTIVDYPMSATGALLSAWLAAWAANEIVRATDMARKGIAEGWSPATLLQTYRGTKANGYKDGLFASARHNTAVTINTAVQHVSSAARVHVMRKTVFVPRGAKLKVNKEGIVTSIPRANKAAAKAAGIKVGDKVSLMGYRWMSILDSRTSQLCRSLDGQVYRFGEGPLPPAHPNCRSTIIAEMPGRWLKRGPTGRFVKRDARPANGAGGAQEVPGSMSYYEWLKTQPPEFQDDALGVTRGALFRKGGLSAEAFGKLNIGRNFQPLTLEEMRRLKPNAFKRAGL